jgi:S-adenosylmethionine hydrolase
MPRSGIVTLTTDFGRTDVYVGVLHGVILELYPHLRVVDLTHDVRPQAVLEGAFLLESAYRYFPAGTVHLAVVDPGVGTERAIVALETPLALFVAPDNGLLGVVWENLRPEERDAARIIELNEPRLWRPQVSRTFHGRDIMAPVAAHLAGGRELEAVGRPRPHLVLLPESRPTRHPDGSLRGQIVHVDHFGNCATNIAAGQLAVMEPVAIEAGRIVLHGLARTYADGLPGEPLALIGSDGRLEIAVREGSAAERLGLDVGEVVWVQPDSQRWVT